MATRRFISLFNSQEDFFFAEYGALLPIVVPLEGKKQSKFQGPREDVGGA
jgi:hypothetical protein